MLPWPPSAACLTPAYARACAARLPRRPAPGVPGAWFLRSETHPDREYLVRPCGERGWACSCPATTLCKHIAAVVGPAPACACGAAVTLAGRGWTCAGCGAAGELTAEDQAEWLATCFTGTPPVGGWHLTGHQPTHAGRSATEGG